MRCKGILQEQNKTKDCWLPANPGSSLQLCRRCSFLRITTLLDTLTNEYWTGALHPENEILLNDTEFLQELLHPAREQALLNLLSALFQENKIQFKRVVEKLKEKTVFSILLTKRIQTHVPGPRCKMYQQFLDDPQAFQGQTLCWNCWSCVTWCLKRKHPYLLDIFLKSFLSQLQKLTFEVYTNNGPRTFVDFLVTLFLLEKNHIVRIFIDHCFHRFPLEDFKSLLHFFFQEPCMLFVFYQNLQADYLPLPFRDEIVVKEFRKSIKDAIKKKTDTYKEELVMRTWHPSRLFPWCLDIQELEEFGISSADRSLGHYGF
jgi:hypothetical protein